MRISGKLPTNLGNRVEIEDFMFSSGLSLHSAEFLANLISRNDNSPEVIEFFLSYCDTMIREIISALVRAEAQTCRIVCKQTPVLIELGVLTFLPDSGGRGLFLEVLHELDSEILSCCLPELLQGAEKWKSERDPMMEAKLRQLVAQLEHVFNSRGEDYASKMEILIDSIECLSLESRAVILEKRRVRWCSGCNCILDLDRFDGKYKTCHGCLSYQKELTQKKKLLASAQELRLCSGCGKTESADCPFDGKYKTCRGCLSSQKRKRA